VDASKRELGACEKVDQSANVVLVRMRQEHDIHPLNSLLLQVLTQAISTPGVNDYNPVLVDEDRTVSMANIENRQPVPIRHKPPQDGSQLQKYSSSTFSQPTFARA